jgi:Fe-S cluster assembly iron-binding protein IscA
MLTMTESARDVVRQLVAAGEGPEEGGVRIVAEPAESGEAALSLELAGAPEAGDEVVEEDGARVFLEAEAASLLDDKILDATAHDDHVHFTVQSRPSADGRGSVVDA